MNPVLIQPWENTILVEESESFLKVPLSWDVTLGGIGHESIAGGIPAPDGGYLIAGSSESNASGTKSENSRGGMDFWVVRLNAQERRYGIADLGEVARIHARNPCLTGW